MMELKGVDELNEVFEQYFVELGYPEIECDIDTDFAQYYGTDEITYSLFEMPEADEGFRRYVNLTYPQMPYCSIFVLSLLHELGHHITLPKYNKAQHKKWEIETAEVENRKAVTPEEKIKKQIDYCGLFSEKIATAEAVKILIANYDYIHNFETVWQEAVMSFYRKNNIENA